MKKEIAKNDTVVSHLKCFKTACRSKNIKITPQRIAIYEELANSKDHPTADTIYKRIKKTFPNISLDTVNRTLLTLVDMGQALTVEGTGQPKRFDADLNSHQHFRCLKCKRIVDFSHKPFDNIEIPPIIGEKFTVLRKTVYFEGICNLCKNNSL